MTGPAAELPNVGRPATVGGRVLLWPIIAYRRWVSPALPARCRFYPSCSAYAMEAITRHGAVRGTALAVWRLLRCHPFHPGGFDPVPDALGRRRRNEDLTGAEK
jgi:putative membrane protein insertion efficiency factor